MVEFVAKIISYYMEHINYFTITWLMTIESSFLPFPSEVIIPPAAWKAAQGQLNIMLVVLFGIVGSIFGAIINYYLAVTLGRTVIYKFAKTKVAKYLLIKKESIEKSERYFNKYGKSSTFVGRLVPGIRQLISIPAGLSKMNLIDFLIYTTLGAGIWNIILAILGYYAYENKELLDKFYNEIWYGSIILGVLFAGFLIYKFIKNKRK